MIEDPCLPARAPARTREAKLLWEEEEGRIPESKQEQEGQTK